MICTFARATARECSTLKGMATACSVKNANRTRLISGFVQSEAKGGRNRLRYGTPRAALRQSLIASIAGGDREPTVRRMRFC